MHVTNAVRWDISKEIVSMMEISPLKTNRPKADIHPWTPMILWWEKWMTNLVATTPITAKAMKNMYAELNRQKGLKRTYQKKYKDLQAIVTIAEHNVSLQQPTVVISTKAKANPKALKVASEGKARNLMVKGKVQSP